MEPRLKTGLVVQAALRLATMQAISILVVRRGDADAGAILIKLNQLRARLHRSCSNPHA